VKRLLRLAAVQRLLASVLAAYARILRATLRWEIENRSAMDAAVASPGGALAFFWHGRISLAVAGVDFLGAKPRRVMISLSRDGDFISMAAERLGVPVIRGSTGKGDRIASKGGGTAYRQAVEFLRAGGAVLMTPDGPRGPREVLALGAVRLAAAAGVPVFLAGLAARPSIKLRSWDGARLPLPFARARLVVDGPLAAPGADNPTCLENVRADWQARMGRAQRGAAARPDAAPTGLRLYALATAALSPFALAMLAFRTLNGKEDRERRGERLGQASRARPPGKVVWLHGASVGESLSLLPLMEAICSARPGQTLLVTSGTRTAAELLGSRLPAGSIHQYAPLDTPSAAATFVDHWRPDLVVFAESELWPNLLSRAKAGGAALALVSARISRASFDLWQKAPRSARGLLGAFDLILARDQEQAERLRALGGRVEALADFKFGGEPLPADELELARVRARIADRPVIVAASTHAGEEGSILQAWRAADRSAGRKSLLIIVPRHPHRGAKIGRLARDAGLSVGLRSEGAEMNTLDVYVADTIGELGLFFRLATLAFVGGSLAPGGGGHNPLEPARLGCPFVTGPSFENWPLYRQLLAVGATRCVTPGELESPFAQAMTHPNAFASMAARALRFVTERDGEARAGIGRVLELLGP
jgi:3-deoxy-D-manno-octulosonic-acid transferase